MDIDRHVARDGTRRGKEQRGIHAMEVGGVLLQHVADAGRPVSMTDLSAAAKLPLNQVFTYMVSLVRTGLVRRDATTHQYEPGPLALRLGLKALKQVYPLQQTLALASSLLSNINHGVFVATWTEHGPTVIQYHGPDLYLNVGLHVGSVMSLAHSSTGRLFSAFLPRQMVEPILAREIGEGGDAADHRFRMEFDGIVENVRGQRLSRTKGMPIPGVDSLSVPVFDRAWQMILAITVFGPSDSLDTSDTGDIVPRMLELTRSLSER